MSTPRKPLPKVLTNKISLGCDPEFFFSKPEVGVVGSEAVLPKKGLDVGGQGKIVIDGVQAELNPTPSTCRESLAAYIRTSFVALKTAMDQKGGDKLTLDFSRSIKISPEEIKKLDAENQRLGCAPSLNISKSKTSVKLSEVDGSKHLQRSAGGHIHLGSSGTFGTVVQWNPQAVVHMLDLIVGNTCVLLDRDPANKERRKLYGKAGEYRLPRHGLEYRTLSNFWLTSYPLMSLVFGLTRTAVELVSDPTNGKMFYDEFTKAVPYAKVRHAINFNNAILAEEIYRTIEPMLMEVTQEAQGHWPVNRGNQADFDHFISKIASDGLEYWFKEEPMAHWIGMANINANGFYNYSQRVIRADRLGQKVAEPTPPQQVPLASGLTFGAVGAGIFINR